MTLRRQIALTFIAVLLLAGMQAGVAVVLLTQIAEGSAELVQPALSRVDAVAHLEEEMLRLQTLQQNAPSDPLVLHEIADERVAIASRLQQYRAQPLDQQRSRMIDLVVQESQQPDADYTTMESQLHQIRHLEYAAIEQLREQLVSAADLARWPLAIAVVLVAVGELILGWSLSRRIMGSLALLRAGARRIARESSVEPIPPPPEAEFAELAATLNDVMGELAGNRAAQRQLEADRARLHRERLGQVVRVQEEERARISRELHDQAGQALTALRYGLDHLQRQYSDASARKEVVRLIDLATAAGQQIGALARDLRPAVLDDLGLVAALRGYSREYSERVGVPVEISAPAPIPRFGADAETTIFRIVQEALTNVAKHANATHVWIEMRQFDHRVEVRVRDDGRGFNTSHLDVANHVGLGLAGIEERVHLLEGNFEIRSEPGQGTSLAVSIPIPRSERLSQDHAFAETAA